MAYYTAFHLVAAAAEKDGVVIFTNHADRLEYLGTKSSNVKRCFDRLYVLSVFARYGECGDHDTVRSINAMLTADNAAAGIKAWVNNIKRALQADMNFS
jgi:hypothetical protein